MSLARKQSPTLVERIEPRVLLVRGQRAILDGRFGGALRNDHQAAERTGETEPIAISGGFHVPLDR